MQLLLFDIDGTLLQRASREHAVALREAAASVHGVRLDGIEVDSAAGRTDGEIARIFLLKAGVSAAQIDERAAAVREECTRRFCELCPESLADKVIAGLPALLEWLGGRDDVRLSLVTGNFEPVARLKLKRAGIGHWFKSGHGGFGSDSEDRTMLPPIARRRVGELDGLGHSWPQAQTVVIGDTPRDIACARADEARVIAVCSGPYAAAQLTAADYVAPDTDALRSALELVLR